ncbi:MAG: HAD family hydrolase [Succinivibrio sp.]
MKFYKALSLSDIKVLSFDLDNTIYDCQSVLSAAENWFTQYLCDAFGLGGDYRSYSYWANIKSRVLHEDMSLENDVTLLRAKSLDVAFREIGIPLKGGLDEALSLVNEFIKRRSAGQVSEPVIKMLESLKEKFPLIAISNGNLDARILGISSLFERDFRPSRFELCRKPAPDLFIECAKFKNVKTHEILHIGDDPYTDVYGAVCAGCRCVWLKEGYTGISPDSSHLKVLPDIEIDSVLELKNLFALA